jgi:zinc transporter ZupT
MDLLVTAGCAVVLAVVQLLPRYLRHLSGPVRSQWLSVAGGVAVAFVFMHLLPELVRLGEPTAELLGAAERVIFVLALVGLIGFYGLEVLTRRLHESRHTRSTWVDQLSIGVFAVYYALIGYLLWERLDVGAGSLIAYTVAMALHFLVVDYGLRQHHREAYVHVGRWVLAAAVLAGWATGLIGQVPDSVLGLLLGFFAGALVLVSLKEELPAERSSHYGAFVGGAAGFGLLLALI